MTIFQHDFVRKLSIEEDMRPEGRYYKTPSGFYYPSVTTVLKGYFNKEQALIRWKAKVGETEAAKITAKAGVKGSILHGMCERYLLNEDPFFVVGNPIKEKYLFMSLRPYLDRNVGTVFGLEIPLYSDWLKTAGRTDLVCEWGGVPSIVDFKSSIKPKREDWIIDYFCQATCYGLMFNEHYNIGIQQIVILVSPDNNQPQLFVKSLNEFGKMTEEIYLNR